MLARFRLVLVCLATALAVLSAAQAADTSANSAAQDAADAIRQAAGTDLAFLAAGLVKGTYDKDNLASLLEYPTEEIVVVSLTGGQVRAALELSVSLYPQPNKSFLQLSGVEATFSKSGATNKRITSVTSGGTKLDDARTYTVAMPSSLARGGLGYFKIWDKSQIQKSPALAGKTMEDVLRGKRSSGSAPRWSAQ